MSDTLRMADILQNWQDGDGLGWVAEFAYLRTFHHERLARLIADMARNGHKDPIVLGDDGRVWDGHHRLCALQSLGVAEVPVRYAIAADTG